MRLYTHQACLRHLPGADIPENPARLQAVIEAISGAWPGLPWHQAPAATRSQLLRVHHPGLLRQVLDTVVLPDAAPVALDQDTLLGAGSAQAALHAAGAGIAAVDALMSGQTSRAFCAVRPPGHHATDRVAMGFCLFNNVAVAAAHACEQYGLRRVAVIDFDVHHGNGTQAIFQADERVMYVSSHQSSLYPHTGLASERGIGNILNWPLPEAADGDVFRAAWREHLLPAVAGFRPQMVFISAGFDAHWRDPLAGLRLQADDFGWLTGQLREIADRHADGRLVSTLEGGYDLEALRQCSLAHVGALLEH
ncbi:histone deacetylase family protein [Lysobacter sp. A289]